MTCTQYMRPHTCIWRLICPHHIPSRAISCIIPYLTACSNFKTKSIITASFSKYNLWWGDTIKVYPSIDREISTSKFKVCRTWDRNILTARNIYEERSCTKIFLCCTYGSSTVCCPHLPCIVHETTIEVKQRNNICEIRIETDDTTRPCPSSTRRTVIGTCIREDSASRVRRCETSRECTRRSIARAATIIDRISRKSRTAIARRCCPRRRHRHARRHRTCECSPASCHGILRS